MPNFMLDTDICSYIMKRSSDRLLKRLARTSISDVCISVITKAELLYGVEVSPRRQQDEAALHAFLQHVESLDFSDQAAAAYAGIRAHLKARGTMVRANDLFIAAHARSSGLTLVTNNARGFGRIPDLRIENWTRP
jgi:tRNA(fMet)-specific endonuclease VapC